ncbi:FAD-dependent oxidoreductase [Clostridium sp.]|uniref:FAD-dependent oxidoreductase n=1 Tax=Clostridium sp. TaxID=1506 RepID=UPI001A5E2937|nr:FAD-dependent oxidoreductase [Clostridium sp.]MBK5235763.1 FAD-dependent oxidoreductase [Clostridium sp.]
MFKKLFSSMNISGCTIPNRLVVTAMVANYCNTDGTATDKYIAYHEAKAKGGLEAARAATLKGHKVDLYERRDFLGGQFKAAAYPPAKGELATYVSWISEELEKLGVNVHLNYEVTEEMIREQNADYIIVATGGNPIIPRIKGVDKGHVCTAEDMLLGKVQPGEKIVVAGGGEVGGETAAHLAMQERAVTIVELQPDILNELDGMSTIQLKNILNYGKIYK